MAIELKSSFLFPKGKGIEFSFVSEESNIDFENKIMAQKINKSVSVKNFVKLLYLLNLFEAWYKLGKML